MGEAIGNALHQLGWVDLLFLAILGVSVVVGLVRGLVFEVLSLVGWLAAYLAAQWLTPVIAPYLPVGQPGSALNHGAAFASGFIAALIVWGLMARLLRMVIHATPLSVIDRALGATFGVARAFVVMLAITTLVMLSPMGHSSVWRASRSAVWLAGALDGLKPVLPTQIAEHLPR